MPPRSSKQKVASPEASTSSQQGRPQTVDIDADEVPATQQRQSKFLKRTNHGQSFSAQNDYKAFNVRIHECLHQDDHAESGAVKGNPSGNFMVAFSTPIGPRPDFKKWSDLVKLECDTIRLNAKISCAFFFPHAGFTIT